MVQAEKWRVCCVRVSEGSGLPINSTKGEKRAEKARIHQFPGCGVTVRCSCVVAQCKKNSENQPRFFYPFQAMEDTLVWPGMY